jgi:serine/threonine-protein kinase
MDGDLTERARSGIEDPERHTPMRYAWVVVATTTPTAPRTVGRYSILGEVASGGMATVYLGRMDGPAGFSLIVAIKRLHALMAAEPEFTEMLRDEARLAGRVRHPNVVPIIDVVEEQGEISLVMEYVRGESLAGLMRMARRRGRAGAPPAIAIALLIGVLDGLHAAHEARGDRGEPLGIVHRDVSPQNVIVGTDGVARVLDFGIAKAAGRLHETLNGAVKGKAPYMSPEQVRGRELDRRSDVYAAAVVLWEVLTGRRLYAGPTHVAILTKVLDASAVPPSTIVDGLPPGLDAVILTALAKEPADRFATAKEFAIALETLVPPASPRLVSDWVLGLAAAAISARAEMESEAGMASASAIRRPPSQPDHSHDREASIPTQTEPEAPLESGRLDDDGGTRRLLGLGVLLCLGFALGLVLVSSLVVARRPSQRSTGLVPPITTTPLPVVVLAPSPTAPVVTAPVAPMPTEDPQPLVPSASARRRAAPRASASASAASADPMRACDPPYTIDAEGIFVPKPQCF